ncbi:hypothetical protein KCU65_g6478, partial [Aureobasidium melanogenum]
MAQRVFITGATGYIGGDILHEVLATFESFSVTALVRDAERAKAIKDRHPQVTLVEGDLDSHQLVVDQASQADIVISYAASNKHLPAVHSIGQGIVKANRQTPVLWLQISGASLLSIPDIQEGRFGEASSKVYDDLDDAIEIRNLINHNPARAVDQNVLDFARTHPERVRAAVIFPPIIFGQGRGLGNTKSIQIPSLCRTAIARHQSVYVGRGQACWGNVHIADLSKLAADLIQAHDQSQHKHDLWNEEGLYFPATGEMTWFTIAEALSEAAEKQGIKAPLSSISVKDVDSLFAHGSILFGTNARSNPGRAKRFLNYKNRQHSLEEEIPMAFKLELKQV